MFRRLATLLPIRLFLLVLLMAFLRPTPNTWGGLLVRLVLTRRFVGLYRSNSCLMQCFITLIIYQFVPSREDVGQTGTKQPWPGGVQWQMVGLLSQTFW